MPKSLLLCFLIFLSLALSAGCGSYQPTKNVWKTTKGLWNSYVSPPASVDYDDKGELPENARILSNSMMGIDLQLAKLERTMQNADRPPTQQWLDQLFVTFPWLSGFAGVKNDGTILGQQPAESLKPLDFIPLLYEDKKQNSHALRADVQPTPQGPEIMLASPLYDGVDFLGIVVAYFDMRTLMKYSDNARDMVVLCPTALLWAGKYDFLATPLAGVDWQKVVRESSVGTCSNVNGSFYYVVRYLGNLPLIFAIPQKGDFPEGDGNIDQGYAVFPKEREKLPPPPVPERKSKNLREIAGFGKNDDELEAGPDETGAPVEEPVETPSPQRPDPNEIQPGSQDSVLLKGGKSRQRDIQERQLEGENVPVERVPRNRRPTRQQIIDQQLNQLLLMDEANEAMQIPEDEAPAPERVSRPSPFGPAEESTAPVAPRTRPSPFGPAKSQEEKPASEENSASEQEPAPALEAAPVEKKDSGESAAKPEDSQTRQESPEEGTVPRLPGGRPSPFGPRK